MLKSHHAIAATFALIATAALAGGDVSLPVAYPIDEPQATEESCAEAARSAAFLRELAKTDGDVNPDTPAIPQCSNEEPHRA